MLKNQELSEIMKCMHNDAETEMSRDVLEDMLNKELCKPEEEMDADLVRELLLLLEDGVTGQEQQEAWRATAEQLPVRRMHPVLKWGARLAATLVILLGLSALTYKTAEAFNWQLVLRLMRPFAETFMLYAGPQPVEEAAPIVTYGETAKPDEPRQYASVEEVPAQLLGYPARPYGMPERFTYLQGSCYSDDLSTSLTHVYSSDDGICIFTLLILNDSEQITSYQYERTPEETREQYFAGCRVTYYLNSDDMTMSAYWTQDNAQYSIFGGIDEAELERIVEATMNR